MVDIVRPQHRLACRRSLVICILAAIIVTGLQLAPAKRLNVADTFWNSGSSDYGLIAKSIVSGTGFALDGNTPTAHRPPLYPLFLSILLHVSDSAQLIVWTQSLLAGLTVGILGFLAILVTEREWAAILVLLQYLTMQDIIFENTQQRETGLFSFFLICSALLFVLAAKSRSTPKVLSLGICLGLLCLARPYAMVICPVLLVWLVVMTQNGLTRRQMLSQSIVLVSGFLFTLLPWGLWNTINLGQFTMTSTTTGLNIWKGNNPATDVLYPSLDVDVMDELVIGDQPSGDGWWNDIAGVEQMSEVERDRLLLKLAVKYMTEAPVRFIRMGVVKLYALWTPKSVPFGTGKVEWTSTGAQIVDFHPNGSRPLVYIFLYFLMGVGIWRLRASPIVPYLIAWILFCSAVHFVTFGETRFRWPINLLSLPVSSAGAVWLLERGLVAVSVVSGRRNVPQ